MTLTHCRTEADPKGWLEGNEQRNLLLKAALMI